MKYGDQQDTKFIKKYYKDFDPEMLVNSNADTSPWKFGDAATFRNRCLHVLDEMEKWKGIVFWDHNKVLQMVKHVGGRDGSVYRNIATSMISFTLDSSRNCRVNATYKPLHIN